MKYTTYIEYKDSGVDRLGKIPIHWDEMPIKFSLSMPITDGPHETPEIFNEGVPFLSAEAVKNDRLDFDKKRGYISKEEHERFSKKYKPKKGDVYMVKSGATTGNVARVETDEEFNIWSPLAVLRPDEKRSTTDFLFFYMKSKSFFYSVELSWSYGTQQNIGMGVIANLTLALPPINEQEKINKFLDHKTQQIDQLIEKKKALIEKLNEQRIAVITQAVTKGLDKNAKMKPSGVDWLGDVPAHWEVLKLKHITSKIIDGAHFTPTYVSEGIPFLRVTDIVRSSGSPIDLDTIKFIPKEEHDDLIKRCNPEKGDLLYSKNGTIGVSRVIDWDWGFSIFVSLCLIKPETNKVASKYLSAYLESKVTQNQIAIGAKSNTVTNLHLDKIKEFIICLPPLEEQTAILATLEVELCKIRGMLHVNNQAIMCLTEYRSALITAAVTGKIDVRNIVIPAKADIQAARTLSEPMDTRLRGYD